MTYAVHCEDDFDFMSDEYAELYDRAGATAFQHPIWLTALYEDLAPQRRAEKQVITVRRWDGSLALVLPLVRRRRGPLRILEFADLGVNDYAMPILDPESVADLTTDVAVSGQIRAALGRFDLLRIERVPDSPDVLLSLIAGADATPHLYATHLVDLADTGEAWRARLDPGFVRHLERKGKRLRPRGDRRFRVVTDVSEVDSLMARMQEFRAVRFAEHRGRDLVQDPGCFRFYCRVARESVATGPGSLSVLEIGGEPVAVAFDLIERDRDLFLLVGYDVGRLRNYSLGLLIVDELAQDAIRRGQAHFDLTVGDEPYKADFGARPRPLFEVRVQRTPLGRAEVAGRAAYLRARQLAKQAVRELERRRSNSDRPIDRRSAVPPGTDGRQARPDRPSPTVTSSP